MLDPVRGAPAMRTPRFMCGCEITEFELTDTPSRASVARAFASRPFGIVEPVDVPLSLALNAAPDAILYEVGRALSTACRRVLEREWLRSVLEGAD